MTFSFRNERPAFCIVAYIHGEVVGWALVERRTDNRHQIGVYVAHEFRRQGIGRRIVRRAQAACEGQTIICCPWSPAGEALYAGMLKADVDRSSLFWEWCM